MQSQKPNNTPQIPETVIIEMTPKLYEAMKQHQLQQLNPVVRGHINTYFEWLKSIQPEDAIDAIERGTTAQQAYKSLGISPLRFGIAAARGFLKLAPKWQEQLREVANPETALMTLKFENPTTYTVIKRYGKRGSTFLENWINGALEVLGVKKPATNSGSK